MLLLRGPVRVIVGFSNLGYFLTRRQHVALQEPPVLELRCRSGRRTILLQSQESQQWVEALKRVKVKQCAAPRGKHAHPSLKSHLPSFRLVVKRLSSHLDKIVLQALVSGSSYLGSAFARFKHRS